jgi:hypothetical protein
MADIQAVSHGDLIVCACGQEDYKARDAVDAALFRDELKPSWGEFLRCLKAEERADELELELDGDAIDNAGEAFRYQHDLITAEETEQWLASHGVTLDDFSDYFARQYWPSALEETTEPEDINFVSASPEQRELYFVGLILSGELDWMTRALMWRIASLVAAGDKDANPEAVAGERRDFLDRIKIDEAKLGDWLTELGRDARWFERMLAMEAAYRSRCKGLLDPQARRKELAMMRIPLTRFEAEMIEVESRDAAQEASFCIREDGMSMEEVAAEAGYPYRKISFLQQEVPNDLEQRFLSVVAGALLEPIKRSESFELYRIIRKVEPQADDPTVQKQIDQRLLERHFADLAGQYVEWRLPTFVSAE